MKNIILTLSIFFLSFSLLGQSDPMEVLMQDPEFTPAMQYLMSGDYESCVKFLDAFDSSHKNYYSIVMLKAQCNWELRDYSELKKDVEILLSSTEKDDPNYADLVNLYGLSLKNTGEIKRSKSVFQEGYETTKNQMLLLNLIQLYNDSQQYKKSVAYENALETDSFGILHFFIGEAFFELGDFDKAEVYLLKYVEKIGNELKFQSYFMLGKIEKEKGNMTKSCESFVEANKSFAMMSEEMISLNEEYTQLS